MSKLEKLLAKVISGRGDADIVFSDLCLLLRRLGFAERTRGSHHIFSRKGVEERINLQECGAKAKPYQVRQVRSVILTYRLEETDA